MRHLSPCHYVLDDRTFLNLHFPGRWIGRAGPLMWAARSHDLNADGHLLWGFIKGHVFTQRIATLQELRNRIKQAAAIIPEMLQDVFCATADKWEVCRDIDGRLVESINLQTEIINFASIIIISLK